MRLLHEPMRIWAEGVHSPPGPDGLQPIRCALGLPPHLGIPMPSGLEARHWSFGFAASAELADGSRGFVLAAPVEPRFDRDALLETLTTSPHHGRILEATETGSVQALATEWNRADQGSRGRLRRLSFYVDRPRLLEAVGFPFVSRYAASLVHIHHELRSFPVVVRQLWLVPAVGPRPPRKADPIRHAPEGS